jgi:hypothetical protein
MTDLVASIFQLHNPKGLFAPKVDFVYRERGSAVQWHITSGGSRAYLMRFGPNVSIKNAENIDGQSADSHFMLSRVLSAYLLSGDGLFRSEAAGRIFFLSVQDRPDWYTMTDFPTSDPPEASPRFYGWLRAFVNHTMLRRAANDAFLALSFPHEAGGFVYRGLEWLVVGEHRSWEDLADDVGVSRNQVREFKKLANTDYGVRHASRSGEKLRADLMNYATWVCSLIDAINATRARLEGGYKPEEPALVAEAVAKATPVNPYP